MNSSCGETVLQVALAPRIDLHTGYHGALRASPPNGVRIEATEAEHVFLTATPSSSVTDPHFGELIRVHHSAQVVHSARWPVLERQAWVVDMDDLLYPLLFGRAALNPWVRASSRGNDPVLHDLLRHRAAVMSRAYLHPSCAAILLRGHPIVRVRAAQDWFAHLGIAGELDHLLEKVTIVRPAQRAISIEQMQAKWSDTNVLRVVFCRRPPAFSSGTIWSPGLL